jgi:hypothetical protein
MAAGNFSEASASAVARPGNSFASATDVALLGCPTGTPNRPREKINFACGINVIGPVRVSRENI